jgi:hypothetical protein
MFVLQASTLISWAQAPSQPSCLTYEPAVVTLTGTVIRKTFPGRPGYESIRHGDEPETYWLLDLPQPICVDEDKSEPWLNEAKQDVRLVQLVVDREAYKKYRRLVGKRVIATGTLFASITGHHHTPVLLTVKTLEPAR